MIALDREHLSATFLRQGGAELRSLRDRVRSWLEENTPLDWRNRLDRIPKADLRIWHRKVYEAGFAAPHWPRAYGGMGASLLEQLVIAEEWANVGAPTLISIPLRFLAPGIMKFGTDRQKEFFLPRILSGELFFCQLYSESEAGSDLANVRTTATRQGDEFLISGTKIWSTAADYADWAFALVRTGGPDMPRSRGLSLVLIDLSSPHVAIRPIKTIYGEDEFCEVELKGVAVPAENILGGVNNGWAVSNEILSAERLSSSSPIPCLSVLQKILRLSKDSHLKDDRQFEERLARLEIDFLGASSLYVAACEASDNGFEIGAHSSILKARMPDLLQELSGMLVEVATASGNGPEDIISARFYLQSRRSTIYGGTAEIQRNIIATRILGLPQK